jgi:hypothetical protein
MYLLIESTGSYMTAKGLADYESAVSEFDYTEPMYEGFVGVWEIGEFPIELTESTSLLYKK